MTLNDFIVHHAGKPGDHDFLRIFGAAEVYFKVDAPGHQLHSGPVKTSPDLVLHMRTSKMKFGNMALFFASREGLSRPFGGMPLMKAVEMVHEMPDVDGLLIQSTSDAWFAVKKDGLKTALASASLPTTLDDYIIQNAGQPGDDEFLREFGSTEVFFTIKPPERRRFRIKALKHLLTSDPATTSPNTVVHMKVAEMEMGNMALFYTSKDKLEQPCCGMPLMKAVQMVYHMRDVDGLFIQSTSDICWFAVMKEGLKDAIDKEGISTRL